MRAAAITFVPGIEITAVREVDVHILGYFFDPRSPGLRVFLAEQRQRRVDRVGRIIAQLETLGLRLDADAILRPAIDQPGKSIGRPAIARALVAAGYVKNVQRGVRAAGCRAAGPGSCRAKARRPTP